MRLKQISMLLNGLYEANLYVAKRSIFRNVRLLEPTIVLWPIQLQQFVTIAFNVALKAMPQTISKIFKKNVTVPDRRRVEKNLLC